MSYDGITFLFVSYKIVMVVFLNFDGAARTPYLMYDAYTNDSLHRVCLPIVIMLDLRFPICTS